MVQDKEERQTGLVVSYFGSTIMIETAKAEFVRVHLRRNQPIPVVGDQVEFRIEQDGTGLVTQILSRHNVFGGAGYKGKLKPLAANVDTILIVMAPPPVWTEYLIDRYIAAAELRKLKVIVILNKVDLLDEAQQQHMHARLSVYQALAYPIVMTSVLTGAGLSHLLDLMSAQRGVLVGPSGVGKSSLISALSSDTSIRIGALSTSGSGRHTTTATRLYHLKQGGSLIDSPGVREFFLNSAQSEELIQGFKEIAALAGTCRFRDCHHRSEPGCRVQAAVEAAKISPSRLQSFESLMMASQAQQKKR